MKNFTPHFITKWLLLFCISFFSQEVFSQACTPNIIDATCFDDGTGEMYNNVVISEVSGDAGQSDGCNDGLVEIAGPPGTNIGCMVVSNSEWAVLIPPNTLIPADGVYLIACSQDMNGNCGVGGDGTATTFVDGNGLACDNCDFPGLDGISGNTGGPADGSVTNNEIDLDVCDPDAQIFYDRAATGFTIDNANTSDGDQVMLFLPDGTPHDGIYWGLPTTTSGGGVTLGGASGSTDAVVIQISGQTYTLGDNDQDGIVNNNPNNFYFTTGPQVGLSGRGDRRTDLGAEMVPVLPTNDACPCNTTANPGTFTMPSLSDTDFWFYMEQAADVAGGEGISGVFQGCNSSFHRLDAGTSDGGSAGPPNSNASHADGETTVGMMGVVESFSPTTFTPSSCDANHVDATNMETQWAYTDHPTPGQANDEATFMFTASAEAVCDINTPVTFTVEIYNYQHVSDDQDVFSGDNDPRTGSLINDPVLGDAQTWMSYTVVGETTTMTYTVNSWPAAGTYEFDLVWDDYSNALGTTGNPGNQENPNECYETKTYTITVVDPLTVIDNMIDCDAGDSPTGTINVNNFITGGSNNSFTLTDDAAVNAPITNTSGLFSLPDDAAAGPYTVTVTDGSGCSANVVLTIADNCEEPPVCPTALVNTGTEADGALCPGSTIDLCLDGTDLPAGGQICWYEVPTAGATPNATTDALIGCVNIPAGAGAPTNTVPVINEILFDGPAGCDGSSTSGEFIEITVAPGTDLSCYILTDGDWEILIPDGTLAPADGYLLIANATAIMSCTAGTPAWASDIDIDVATCNCTSGETTIMELTNGGEFVNLYDAAGTFIHGMVFDVPSAGNSPTGTETVGATAAGCTPPASVALAPPLGYPIADANYPQGDGESIGLTTDGDPNSGIDVMGDIQVGNPIITPGGPNAAPVPAPPPCLTITLDDTYCSGDIFVNSLIIGAPSSCPAGSDIGVPSAFTMRCPSADLVAEGLDVCHADQGNANLTVNLSGLGAGDMYSIVYAIDGLAQPAITATGTATTAMINITGPTAGELKISLVSVTNTTANGCTGTIDTDEACVNIRATPTATITAATDIMACDGTDDGSVTFSFTGNGPYDFAYTINGGALIEISSVSSPYTLNTTTPGVYALGSIADDSGCEGTIDVATQTVSNNTAGAAVVSVVQPAQVCNDGTISFDLTDDTQVDLTPDYVAADFAFFAIDPNGLTPSQQANPAFQINSVNNITSDQTVYALYTDPITGCQSTATIMLDVDAGQCAGCPIVGSIATINPVCFGTAFDVTASGLNELAMVDNGNQDFGIEFVAFTAATADPYAGGTSLGTVANGSLTGVNPNQMAMVTGVGGSLAAGDYVVYAILTPDPTDAACRPSANTTLTVNALPTFTPGAAAEACMGATSADLAYTMTENCPDQYSIDFEDAAEDAGFVDVAITALPISPISLTIPAGAAAATYNATITVTNSGNSCMSTPTAFTVIINAPPTATPVAAMICEGGSTTVDGNPSGGSGIYTNHAWTDLGTGTSTGFTLMDTNTQTVSVDGTTATTGTINLQYQVTDDNGCVGMENVTITVNEAATADAGADQTTCGTAPVALSATTNGTGTWSGGAGTFDDATMASTNYNPTAAEIGTMVTLTFTTSDPDAGGPCVTASDDMVITIDTELDAEFAYNPTAFCQSDTDPTPTHTTGVDGMYMFTATVGGPTLVIDPMTGTIDLSASDVGTYEVTNTVSPPTPSPVDLIITGIIDGPLAGGTPKAIELYVINDIPDLSIYGLENASNGGASGGAAEYNFPADAVVAGTYIYLASESTQFMNWFGFAPTYTTGTVTGNNGDDVIILYNGTTAIDAFGEVGIDGSGENWEYLDGWAYRMDMDNATPAFDENNWLYSTPNALDNETSNAAAATPFPLGTYVGIMSTVCPPAMVMQTITIEQAPDLSTADMPVICNGESFDLTSLTIMDANNTTGTFSYHSATPANAGNELASTMVSPAVSTTYYILKTTNTASCTDELAVEIQVSTINNITATMVCTSPTTYELRITFDRTIEGASGQFNANVNGTTIGPITYADYDAAITADGYYTLMNASFDPSNMELNVPVTITDADAADNGNLCSGMTTFNEDDCCPADAGDLMASATEICNNQTPATVTADYTAADETDPNAAGFTYIWIVTDGTAPFTIVNDIDGNIAAAEGANSAPYTATLPELAAGTYCLHGISYQGTFADFTAQNYTTAQAIQDDIDAATICADIELNCITYTVNEAATADAGADQTVCGTAAVALAATTNGTGAWTGGAGTYDDATMASTNYNPTAAEIGTMVTLTWTTADPDAGGPCVAANDDMVITIDMELDAEFAYNPTEFCQSDTDPTPTHTTGVDGTYTFTATLGGPTLVIDAMTGVIDLSASDAGTYEVTNTVSSPPPAPADLVITGIIDGPLAGGTPKAIELYVINDIPDLSIYGIENASNGAASGGAAEYNFPADAVTAGTYIYLASESTQFMNWFGFMPTYTNGGVTANNGDDVIILYNGATAIDAFGAVGTDGTGENWEYLDGWAYRMDLDNPTAAFDENNWTYSGRNALDGETDNATANTPFPLGTYQAAMSTVCPPAMAMQTITIEQAPDLSTADMPVICNGESFDLTTLIITDANNTTGNITFHSATPATAANQLASTTVSPTISTTYYVLKSTNAASCADELAVEIQVSTINNVMATMVCTSPTTYELRITFDRTVEGASGQFNANVNGILIGPITYADYDAAVATDGYFSLTDASFDPSNIELNVPLIITDANVASNGNSCSGMTTFNEDDCCPADAGDLVATVTEICNDQMPATVSADYTAADEIDPNSGATAPTNVRLNEIRIDQPGGDDDEYFELCGMPGTDLSNLTLIVIGDGNATTASGVIENVTALTGQTIPATGYFVAAMNTFTLGTADLETSLSFENSDNLTFFLVDGFTGSNGDDLDTDDDGVLDAMPWASIVSEVALIETVGSGEQIYSTITIGPDGTFVPAHSFFDGVNWQIGQFDPVGGDDTPGAANIAQDFAYIWVVTDGTAPFTIVNDIDGNIAAFEGLGSAPYTATLPELAAGTYCIHGISYQGTFADFTAANYTTGQALQDDIDAGTICADIELADCIPYTVSEAATVDVGADLSTCQMGLVALNATTNSTGMWTGGAGIFTNANNASTTYAPAASEEGTTVTLTFTTIDPDGAGPCAAASDALNLTINSQGDANFTYPDLAFCQDEFQTLLPIFTTGVANSFSYTTTAGGPNLVINPATGEVIVFASDPGVYEVSNTIPSCGNLMITGVMDGTYIGGSPKVIELIALQDIADLSLYGLGAANNGGGSDGIEFTFPADAITAGTHIYVTNNSVDFETWFGFSANYETNTAVAINGDDAIELFCNGNILDVFGDINTDGSGQTWEYTDGWAYRSNDACPNNGSFDETAWTYSGTNALDNTVDNSVATPPFPNGTATTICTGGCPDAIETLTLVINPVPTIDVQPISAAACEGEPATFSVTASGPNVSYQWFQNNIALSNGGIYSGTNTPVLMISDNTGLNGATFHVIVTTENTPDPDCPVQSETVTLTVAVNQLACNNGVQVSFDENCEALITPDMILEGSFFEDFIDIEIVNNVGQILPNPLTGEYAGQTLTVRATDICTDNLCWGSITLEDKLGPEMTCTNVQIDCTQDPNNPAFVPLPIATDGCDGLLNVEITNETIDADDACTIVTIMRTYTAFDSFGNEGESCIQTIEILPGLAPDFPADATWTCEEYDAFPNVTHPTPLTGILSTTGSGIPNIAEGTYCNYTVTHSDDTLQTCGGLFKIVRTWTVLNWCNGELVTLDANGDDNIQIIKIADDIKPTILQDAIFVDANIAGVHPQPCRSTEVLPAATIMDNCAGIMDVQTFTPTGVIDGNGGAIPAPGLEVGTYDITYVATDSCGNVGELTVQLTVKDDIAPVAVCDQLTQVSIPNIGDATVYAETFDDGSSDNCCLDRFEVRRMQNFCPGQLGDLVLGESVHFCCEDIGQTRTVVLRVYDCYDNFNECMVEVLVEDKLPPVLAECPADEAINCDVFYNNIEVDLDLAAANNNDDPAILNDLFGMPTYIDNCDMTVVPTYETTINSCGEGSITRTWTASDPSENAAETCTQIITIHHVNNWEVEFPADITVTCGNDLPDFNEPTVFFDDCELIAIAHEDIVFNIVPDACYKIIRTWTAINWCVYDGDDLDDDLQIGFNGRRFRDGTDGVMSYQQVVKVIDNIAPVIVCPAIEDYEVDGNCLAIVTLPFAVDTSDCSNAITVTVSSDLGLGYGPFTDIEPGTYTATYTATDNCGNSQSCETTFHVVDNKAPTPYCVSGLVVELMGVDTDGDAIADEGMLDIWASDFDAGSFDNCSDVRLSVWLNMDDESQADSTVMLACDSPFEWNFGVNTVYLYVTDAAGNTDFCVTTLIVESNPNIPTCISNDPQIAGTIQTESGTAIEVVEVSVNANNATITTTETGDFVFELAAGGDYTIVPTKDINPLNGVTTYDLVLINQHILGTNILDTPYKRIAADANNSQSITAYDLVQLRRLILMVDTEFANNTSWRFVSADYTFPNAQNPWQTAFPETADFNNLQANETANFIGVKIGDVNGSAAANSLMNDTEERSGSRFDIHIDNQDFEKGAQIRIPFSTQQLDKLGAQFTLDIDQDILEIESLEAANWQAEHFNTNLLNDHAITASWNGKLIGEELFVLVATAKKAGQLSDVFSISDRYTKAEAYTHTGLVEPVALVFNAPNLNDLILHQNEPNPFTISTTIRYELPAASLVTLTVSDAMGKVLWTKETAGLQGMNSLPLAAKDLAAGVYYYQIKTRTDAMTRKMIVE